MTDQHMDHARLTNLRRMLDANDIEGNPRLLADLLEDRDEWHRLATRHGDLRRQAEAVCERRTAEREQLLTEVNALRTGLLDERAKTDESRLSLCRKTFELSAQLRTDPPGSAPRPAALVMPTTGDRRPVWCFSAQEVAAVWGWGYLYADAPGCEKCWAARVMDVDWACSCDEPRAESLPIKLPPRVCRNPKCVDGYIGTWAGGTAPDMRTPCTRCACDLPTRGELEKEPRKTPDPLDMHGACDEFGGSDY